MIGLGTIANAGAVIVGASLGVLIHSRLSEKMINILFQGMGLITITLGISMGITSDNIVLIVISIVVGSLIGQWIDIESFADKLANKLQQRAKNMASSTSDEKQNQMKEGFLTASLLFCVGSLAILGALEDGRGETPNLLYAKSVMDGISSIALASSFGIGVALSSVPILIYQGGLTLFAVAIMRFLNDQIIIDLTATGGILLIGLGISIMKIKDIKVINMLPSLVIIVILSAIFGS